MTRPAVILVILLALAAPAASADLDFSDLDRLVVLNEGRRKPFDTFARETVRRVFDSATIDGQDPVETTLSMLVDPASWMKRPFLSVTSAKLAKDFFADKRIVSPGDVVDRARGLEAIYRQSQQAKAYVKAVKGELPAEMRKQADELIELGTAIFPLLDRTQTLRMLRTDLKLIPTARADQDWLTLEEAAAAKTAAPVVEAWQGVATAYRAGDASAFSHATKSLIDAQRLIRPTAMLSPTVVDLEIGYNAVNPRVLALITFSVVSLLFLLHVFVRRTVTGLAATFGLLAGIAVNTYVVGLFTLFAGRLPLRNVNEVFLVVLWFVPVIAILLQWMLRNRVYGGVCAGLSVIGYIGSLFLPIEGYQIRPLVAILDSSWREIHILSIMLSYAILFVAFGIHMAYLGARFKDGWDKAPGDAARSLDDQAYHLLAWGFLFLTCGIATGAAWGHDAWGRYWGWDPKEVWATIAWVIYAVFLHLRIFARVRGGLLAALNALGFAAIMFTYFGVTYLLSGLHSYGAS